MCNIGREESTFASRSGVPDTYYPESASVSVESYEEDDFVDPRSLTPRWNPFEFRPMYNRPVFVQRERSDIFASVEEQEMESSEESAYDLGRFIRVQSKWPYNRKYNPDYVVNPTLMAKRWRRRPPPQKAQFLKGHWGGNPREGWRHPITGAEWTS